MGTAGEHIALRPAATATAYLDDAEDVAAAKAEFQAVFDKYAAGEVALPVAPVHEYTLPVAPVHEYTLPVAPVFDGKAPEPVQDNPEVAAAKATHIAKVEGNVLPAEHVFAAEELPVAPVHVYSLPVAPVYDGKAPEPVQDEPEVA